MWVSGHMSLVASDGSYQMLAKEKEIPCNVRETILFFFADILVRLVWIFGWTLDWSVKCWKTWRFKKILSCKLWDIVRRWAHLQMGPSTVYYWTFFFETCCECVHIFVCTSVYMWFCFTFKCAPDIDVVLNIQRGDGVCIRSIFSTKKLFLFCLILFELIYCSSPQWIPTLLMLQFLLRLMSL